MSTRRPGAEDPGEAWADGLQEFMRAERGLRRGYKSPEDADIGETHSQLQDPVGLGDTHRDGQGFVRGPGVVDQQIPHQRQGSPRATHSPISPLGHKPERVGQGQTHCHPGAPAKTHCSWGKSHREPTAPAER